MTLACPNPPSRNLAWLIDHSYSSPAQSLPQSPTRRSSPQTAYLTTRLLLHPLHLGSHRLFICPPRPAQRRRRVPSRRRCYRCCHRRTQCTYCLPPSTRQRPRRIPCPVRQPAMGLAYNTYLNSNKIYGCKSCKTHLANHEDIISRVCSPSPPPSRSLSRSESFEAAPLARRRSRPPPELPGPAR